MRTPAVIALAAMLTLTGCGDDADDEATGDSAGTTAPSAAADFGTLDANGDSYLDVDEIAEWADDGGIYEQWNADADSELDRDEIAGNAFNLWDADGNGTISEAEWVKGTDLWYPEGPNPVIFGDWDGDRDSELDADEFKERFDSSQLGESWRVEPLDEQTFQRAYFELYDSDDDGKVSESEWTAGSAAFGSPRE
ncbi:MAG: hypothetical protein M3179_05865 [Actinomycetota bacterium]|nr:hypothetical protein [Actinomycetota bacterium]